MPFTTDPSLSESYLTVRTSPRISDTYVPFLEYTVRPNLITGASTMDVVENIWLKELTGVEVVTPVTGTPTFTGTGGGSTRPASGFVYPRGSS